MPEFGPGDDVLAHPPPPPEDVAPSEHLDGSDLQDKRAFHRRLREMTRGDDSVDAWCYRRHWDELLDCLQIEGDKKAATVRLPRA
jgi:hypothetical protein